MWLAIVAGIPGRSWTGRVGKPKQPEERRTQPPSGSRYALEGAKIGPKPSQDRAQEAPKRGHNALKIDTNS